MKTLKELADIGAAAAFADNRRYYYMSISEKAHSWVADEPTRQAFAQAVRDAVEKPLRDEIIVMGAKIEELEKNVKLTSHSWFPHPPPTPPTTKTVPLDINDIRATDEFRHCSEPYQVCPLIHAGQEYIRIGINHGFAQFNYAALADNYLRRQHGSDEWKPCTKEVAV